MNPGDEMIMVEPGYANYISFAVTAGIKVVTVTSYIEDGFKLPPMEDFERAITDKTKAILLCNPNNPTGYVYSPEELQQLKELVVKHDLYLIADEVYREFVYTNEPYVSAMSLGIPEHVILVDSVSKRYSECGIRIGALITKNAEVRKAVMKYCQARLSPPLLGQLVADASIEGTEEYSKQCYNEYKERRDFFIKGLNSIPGVQKGFTGSKADAYAASAIQKLFIPGDKVRHPKFGFGTVTEVSGNGADARIRIQFETAGERELSLTVAPIVKVEEQK